MKKFSIIACSAVMLLFSCGKKNDGEGPNAVKINGKVYATITIGNQIWTATNYTGPGGGLVPANTPDSAIKGNYYSTSNIKLPAGWRVPTLNDFNTLMGNYSYNTGLLGNTILSLVETEDLMSTTDWVNITGTNSTKFNAYAAGDIALVPSDNKIYPSGGGRTACFLSSTILDFTDAETGLLAGGPYILELSNAASIQYGNTLYGGITTESHNPEGVIGCASVRFVKDK